MRKLIKITKRGRRLLYCYQSVFRSKEGKAVLRDLMKKCFVLDPIDGSNCCERAEKEGQRKVILHILDNLGLCKADIEGAIAKDIFKIAKEGGITYDTRGDDTGDYDDYDD